MCGVEEAREVVWVVEDNPADAHVICEGVRATERDVDVVVHGGGVAALDALDAIELDGGSGRPSLILLDINMPRVSGHLVLEHVKSTAALRDVPVIMLSSSDADHDLRTAYANHANAYLVKGYDFAELIELVREATAFWLSRVARAA